MEPFQVTKLPNGATIATAEMPHMYSATLGLFTRAGSRHERRSLNGIAHFVEHMVFKGTPDRTALQIVRDIEGAGGTVNAYTELDHTCYHATAGAAHLPLLADVIFDFYSRPTFDPDEIVRERQVIEEEITMYRENPGSHVEDVLSATAYPRSPLGRPITGTPETLAGIARPELRAWVGRAHTAENTVVVVAGNAEHGDVVKLLTPYLDKLPSGPRVRTKRVSPDKLRTGLALHAEPQEIEQAHVMLGFHTAGRHSEARHALRLLNVILGENMSSRLFQSLREEAGLCYSISTDSSLLEDTGLFTIYAGLDPADLIPALKRTSTQLRKIVRKAPPKVELERAVEYTLGGHHLALESTDDRAMALGEALIGGRGIPEFSKLEAALRAVTPKDISAIAGSIFTSDNLALALVGPHGLTLPPAGALAL